MYASSGHVPIYAFALVVIILAKINKSMGYNLFKIWTMMQLIIVGVV